MPPADRPAEVEIGIYRWDAEHYGIDLRYTAPGRNGDVSPRSVGRVQLDTGPLAAVANDPDEYGRLVGEGLFQDAAVRTAFAQCRADAATYLGPNGDPWPLRVRLYVSPNAPELHALRWETLIDPTDGVGLAAGEQVVFSRYLISPDWRPLRPAPGDPSQLRVVLAVADPSDLGGYRPGGRPLSKVDVDGEVKQARVAMVGPTVVELSSLTNPLRRPTLDNILRELRDGCDFLYLVCHGAIPRGEPLLWLEDESGQADTVTGAEFVARVRDLGSLPRLIVLASCQSAGDGLPGTADAGALAALGPRLAEVGVPAVLAMQGNVTMATVAQFMPVFFAELLRDGQIDRAAGVARRKCDRTRSDWWVPALYHRLRNGNLWGAAAVPAAPAADGVPWDALILNIRSGNCTPVLGSGMLEPLVGPTREVARRWAETYRFPLAPHDRDDLPQVAQFLEVTQDRNFPRTELTRHLGRVLRERFRTELAAAGVGAEAPLDDVLRTTASALRTRPGAVEPHALLAALPFRMFVTTNGDTLLEEALRQLPAPDGPKPPTVLSPSFDPDEDDPPADVVPSVQAPGVCRMFGRFDDPLSLVLTEDDYFRYLIKFTAHRNRLPSAVRRRLVGSSLLFLGFRLDEWDFRVMLETIDALPGRDKLRDYAQVAVQIDPQGGRFIDPESARRYLERHTQFTSASISIFWGSLEEFLLQLSNCWAARPAHR